LISVPAVYVNDILDGLLLLSEQTVAQMRFSSLQEPWTWRDIWTVETLEAYDKLRDALPLDAL
jgi:hypothetical protein